MAASANGWPTCARCATPWCAFTRRPASAGLFVNDTFTAEIEGLLPTESDALLRMLYQHSVQPERVVRWRWREGDVAFWDNRSTAHYATADYGDARRVMHRVTIAGDRPVGVDGPID